MRKLVRCKKEGTLVSLEQGDRTGEKWLRSEQPLAGRCTDCTLTLTADLRARPREEASKGPRRIPKLKDEHDAVRGEKMAMLHGGEIE